MLMTSRNWSAWTTGSLWENEMFHSFIGDLVNSTERETVADSGWNCNKYLKNLMPERSWAVGRLRGSRLKSRTSASWSPTGSAGNTFLTWSLSCSRSHHLYKSLNNKFSGKTSSALLCSASVSTQHTAHEWLRHEKRINWDCRQGVEPSASVNRISNRPTN